MYVKTIAEEKTISKAAQKLFVAQPSLSQSLQRIEEALGARLFNRTAGGLTLTYAGERYYHMATQILKMYQDFETEVSDINNLKTGRIRGYHQPSGHHRALQSAAPLPHPLSQCGGVRVRGKFTFWTRKSSAGELDFAVMHAPRPGGFAAPDQL